MTKKDILFGVYNYITDNDVFDQRFKKHLRRLHTLSGSLLTVGGGPVLYSLTRTDVSSLPHPAVVGIAALALLGAVIVEGKRLISKKATFKV